jgi:Ca2+-binding EF-hand superfamily protein
LWTSYDKNGNGLLDKEEAKKFLKSFVNAVGKSGPATNSALESAFILCDTNHSGYINKTEMTEYCRKVVTGQTHF